MRDSLKMKGHRPFTIFIVEDNSIYTFFLNEFLKDHGNFSITTFENAENCISVMDTKPDVVIQDYILGDGMNGGDAFRAIKKKYPGIPVIILSAQKDVQVAADLLQEGLYAYIEKKDREALDKIRDAILEISSR